jgi:putative membrane protein
MMLLVMDSTSRRGDFVVYSQTLAATGLGRAFGVILLLSAAVLGFLLWLVYVKQGAGYSSKVIDQLPAVNAALNSLSTVFLVAAFIAVKNRLYRRHMKLMLAALCSSALFFVCYVVYHDARGDVKFHGAGEIRPVYFSILISHIVLSAVVVPMILGSFYLSLSGRFALHRKFSRWTFPIWLYVSVTGVIVFAMLKIYSSAK